MVDDDVSILLLVSDVLEEKGLEVTAVRSGEEALRRVEEGRFDLILLDIMLPGIDGYELLEYSKLNKTPVIFITAMGDLNDRVKGLRAGADDYITKPFEMIEMLARVETVLRRYHKTEDEIRVLDAMINIPSRTVMQNGQQVELTMKEFDLLLFLVRNKNIALYRETIYEKLVL